ncbi:MAG: hypothetical protein ACRDRN_08230 [Sciscionella sp.]
MSATTMSSAAGPRALAQHTLRVLRAPQTLLLSIGLSIVLFLVFSHVGGGQRLEGLSQATYTMVSMAGEAAIGTVMFATAALVAQWHHGGQPGPVVAGLATWLASLPAMAAVYLVAALSGVRLAASQWVAVFAVSWLAAIPFVLLGVALGFVRKAAMGITLALFVALSVLGGLWMPSEVMPSPIALVARALPSYWLGMAGRAAAGAPGFGGAGVLVLVGWTVAIGAVVTYGYRAYSRSGSVSIAYPETSSSPESAR